LADFLEDAQLGLRYLRTESSPVWGTHAPGNFKRTFFSRQNSVNLSGVSGSCARIVVSASKFASAALRFCFSSESCFDRSTSFAAWNPSFFSSGVGGSEIAAFRGSRQYPHSF
jgi:hypothetical protein